MRQWRLIYDAPASGARNMAIDEAIFLSVASGEQPPTLRLYDWEPLCLSLGYAQRASDVDFERTQQRGWHVVRRRTGGRAILHGDELTYSIVVPANHPLIEGDVATSYRRISRGLQAGLTLLEIETRATRYEKLRGAHQDPVCFEIPSDYEITIAGKKLIGSAQYRRQGGVLQHGSLPLFGDVARICDVLFYASELERKQAKERVRQRAATLAGATGRFFSRQVVADAIAEGFSQHFGIAFTISGLTDAEKCRAGELERDVYSTEEWIRRRK